MNATKAIAIHQQFLELSELVKSKLPKEIQVPDEYDPGITHAYDLHTVHLENLSAMYRLYMGCGEYEYYRTNIDLNALFGA